METSPETKPAEKQYTGRRSANRRMVRVYDREQLTEGKTFRTSDSVVYKVKPSGEFESLNRFHGSKKDRRKAKELMRARRAEQAAKEAQARRDDLNKRALETEFV